jgi:16S rRNA (cytosine967-C5)-methyltransferase
VSPARAAAFAILRRLQRTKGHVDLSFEGAPELRQLDRRDRALAVELVAGTVRRRNSLDAVLASVSHDPLSRVRPEVLEALRLGAYQLLYMDRVPAHAAVAEGVALVSDRGAATRGYVNAVLRQVSRVGRQTLADLSQGTALAALAIGHSQPQWIVRLLVHELGQTAAEELLAASNLPPERCLRVNSLCATVEEAQTALREDDVATTQVPGFALALVYEGPLLESTRAFRMGMVTPQSRGSQLAAAVAAREVPGGGAVADLCAAPGTKTSQLAAELPSCRILAVDSDPNRVAALRKNLDRLQAAAVTVLEADATALRARDVGQFDAVLVDAPCTGLGTLASRPDLRWRGRPADVRRLATVQTSLLANAAGLVRPGGTLTYSVCTVTRAETVDVVAAIAAGGGWRLADLGSDWPQFADPRLATCLLTLPSAHGTSGFFIARLHKSAAGR